MKILHITAAAALLTNTIIASPAFAFTVGTATIEDPLPAGLDPADAQAVCNDLADAHGAAWTGTLDASSIHGSITTGPTATGERNIDESSVAPGDGAVQIGESIQVYTDPFRIGGSVNMFGMAHVVAAHWDFSQYDFTQAFAWQSTYTFTCDMSEEVPTPALGVHNWTGPVQAGDPAIAACEGDKNPHVFDDRGANCEWVQTIPAGTVDQPRDPEQGSIGPVDEGGTLSGHESHGGSIPVDPDQVDLPDIQVVVCISPSTSSKKTAANGWAKKNGYNGDKCTTTWYNSGAMNQPDPYSNLNTGSNNIVTIPNT